MQRKILPHIIAFEHVVYRLHGKLPGIALFAEVSEHNRGRAALAELARAAEQVGN